jgi:hypothetical protein
MTFQSRLMKLEKGLGETSRSPVVGVTIDGEKLIHVRLQNGITLTGSEAQQALEEARKKRDPFKVFSGFDPHNVGAVNANRDVP